MKASKRTQPYRKKGMRPPGNALANMLRGARVDGRNPMDSKRRAAKNARKRKPPRTRRKRRIRR